MYSTLTRSWRKSSRCGRPSSCRGREIGPVVTRLTDAAGHPVSGEIVMTNIERQALSDDKLYVSVASTGGKAVRAPLARTATGAGRD